MSQDTPSRYYYFTLIGQWHNIGWRVKKCQGDFPLKEVMDENTGMVVTFWKEISEVEANKFCRKECAGMVTIGGENGPK